MEAVRYLLSYHCGTALLCTPSSNQQHQSLLPESRIFSLLLSSGWHSLMATVAPASFRCGRFGVDFYHLDTKEKPVTGIADVKL